MEKSVGHLLTLQAFEDKHVTPPPPLQSSLNDIFIEKFNAFVKELEVVIVAVGDTVSVKQYKIKHISIASYVFLN